MNIAIISCFRDSDSRGHLAKFFSQVAQFEGYVRTMLGKNTVEVVASEGDSTDNTLEALSAVAASAPYGVTIVNGTHGGQKMGSVTDVKRMRQFAHAANQAYEAVRPDIDVVINVESDLLWEAPTLWRLVFHVRSLNHFDRHGVRNVDIVAPMVFVQSTGAFYDLFSYRFPGEGAFSMTPDSPYHPEIKSNKLVEVDSVGSCLVMTGDVARSCRMQPEDAVVGFCRVAREKGYRIWLDPQASIYHPG